MAIKNLLPLIGFCAAAAFAQTLPERVECKYERHTEKATNGSVSTRHRETCIEEPGVEIRQYRIGDIMREAHLPPHPVIKQDFLYRNSRCRWFAQINSRQRDLVQYQGIACEVQPNVWRVIDKF